MHYPELRDDPLYHFDSVQLIALSACQTGTSAGSRSQDGAEIDALGDVAASRGAKAVLATLWSVNDASTSEFMKDFYRNWVGATGARKVEALRKAQVDMLTRDFPKQQGQACPVTINHPYFWAPFVLIGNWQ